MATKFNFERVRQNYARVKTELPKLLANDAQTFFFRSFNNQGFTNYNLIKWKEVKRRQANTPEYKYPKTKGLARRTKPILIQTGTLRKAVNNSIRSISFYKTTLVVDLPYAAAQNYGSAKKNIPARKYMGDSTTLRKIHRKRITATIDRIWKA